VLFPLFRHIVHEFKQQIRVTWRIQGAPAGEVFAAQGRTRLMLPFLGSLVFNPALESRDRSFSSVQSKLSCDLIAPFARTPDVNGLQTVCRGAGGLEIETRGTRQSHSNELGRLGGRRNHIRALTASHDSWISKLWRRSERR
jgi:hypothetical protein